MKGKNWKKYQIQRFRNRHTNTYFTLVLYDGDGRFSGVQSNLSAIAISERVGALPMLTPLGVLE